MADDLQRELVRLAASLTEPDLIDEVARMGEQVGCAGDRRYALEEARVASPCKVKWEDMTGEDRVRVCKSCERPVFNLSHMTRAQAESVLAARGVTPCVRFYRRADGTVMTTDCAPGARRSKRLAVLAAGTVLTASAPALAEPDPPADTDDELAPEDPGEWTEGILIISPPAPRPTVEWSSWVRVGGGEQSRTPAVAARSTAPVMAEPSRLVEGALGADASVPVALDGTIRLGAFGELRTSTAAVLGGELIIEGARDPYRSGFDGRANLVVRAGGNAHLVTAALGVGYLGSWSRTDPWIRWLAHTPGVRLVASVNHSLDDPRDWSATLGVELDPIGAVRGLVRR